MHVQDVERSIAFYSHLGFAVTSVYTYQDQPVWAALASDAAELMVTTDGETIDPERQGILFYLYCQDLLALRTQLLAAGLDPGAIVDGTPGPTQELRLVDPEGYVLMIAQND